MPRTPLVSVPRLLIALLLATAAPRGLLAQTPPKRSPPPDPPLARHVLEGNVGSSNFDLVAAELGYRHAFPSRLQLGLRLGTALSREAYFGGYAADRAVSTEASARLFLPVLAHGPLLLQLRVEAGARVAWSRDDDLLARGAPGERVTAITGAIGLRANVAASSRLILWSGMRSPLSVQVDPVTTLDVTGSVIEAGLAYGLNESLWLVAGADAGGLFGSGGDAGKVLLAGYVGVRGLFGGSANPDVPRGTPARAGGATLGAFVHTGWRISHQARHLSHGPAVEAGVLLFQHLKIGIASHARPGPMNPRTFEATPVNGQLYKGKDRLALRSDGAFIGLLLAPMLDLGGTPLTVEAPVTVGQGAYGFYLTGADRDTPDTRRVSEWEDALFGGKDSGAAFGVDAGLRVAAKLRPWLRVAAGAHYTKLFGYDSYVRASYDGPSASLGLELGSFE